MEEEMCQTLPDELVERIISRVPFPDVFKARFLSKAWQARFAPVSSLQDPAQKCRAIAFQELVREGSDNWGTFAPVSIDQIAYNPASQTWHKMPSLGHLPWMDKSRHQIVGPLLFASRRAEYQSWSTVKRCRGEVSQRPHLYDIYEAPENGPMPHELHRPNELYVANILTGSWKPLPPRPNAALGYAYCETLLINPSSETYTVIVFCRDHTQSGICNGYSAQIYDSKSGVWESQRLRDPHSFFGCISSHTYFNGVIYMVQDASMHHLMAYDVEKRTWKELRLLDAFWGDIEMNYCVDLVVCNSNLMMVVQDGETPEVDCLHVLKVNLESQELWKVAKCPPPFLNLRNFMAARPVSDGLSIFLGYGNDDGRMVARKVDEVIISLNEKKKVRKIRINAEREILKKQIRENKALRKVQKEQEKVQKELDKVQKEQEKEMHMKVHGDDEDEDEYKYDFEEDYEDDDFDDSEDDDDWDEDDEEEEDEDDEDYKGEYGEVDDDDDWICFHGPPGPEATMTDLRDGKMPNNGQGTKRSRKQKSKVRDYKWCGSSFQPGLNPFMAV